MHDVRCIKDSPLICTTWTAPPCGLACWSWIPSPTKIGREKLYSILFYSLLFYSILFYSILFYFILYPMPHVVVTVSTVAVQAFKWKKLLTVCLILDLNVYNCQHWGFTSMDYRGSQRDVVLLGWPIAPSYMEPKCGGGEGWVVSSNEYSCAHGAQINFGDLVRYLTYDGYN
jgi:hypothetical protein